MYSRVSTQLALALAVASAIASPLRARDDGKPGLPYDDATTPYCSWWIDYQGSQTCKEVVEWNWIELSDFRRWNPSIGPDCDGMISGRSYCIEAIDEPEPSAAPTTSTQAASVTSTEATSTQVSITSISSTRTSLQISTTASAGNGIETPEPVHDGIVDNCNDFHLVEQGDSCATIASKYGINVANIISWNGLNSGCTNLWRDTYACVSTIGFTAPTTSAGPATTTTEAGNGIATPTPIQPGMVQNCNKFHLIKDTTTCQGIADYNKIAMADFFKWNTGINKACTNLWLGTYACAGVIGSKPVSSTTTRPATTTTKAGNGIATPTPIQPGMVDNCNKFHPIKDTTTCQGIADYNKITIDDFFKWNTGINKACTNLWLGAYACAGVVGSKPITTTKPVPTTTTQPSNGVATPSPILPGIVSNCNKFHLVKSTTTCQGIVDYHKITMTNFRKWNTGINSGCTNLLLGYYACAGVIGGSPPPPTTAKPSTGVATPTPIQAGMTKGCTKFHHVRSTTTCQGILDYNKISLAKFVKWNPAVKSDCSNLWTNTYACVAGP